MAGAPTRRRGRSRYPTRSRNAGATGAAPVPDFDPLTDITWAKLYWASDPDWTPPADGATVASWRNAGSVAGDATQGTEAVKPLYDATYAGLSDQPALVFDGTDDGMVSAAFTGIPQPWSWVMVVDVTSLSGSNSFGTPQFAAGGGSSLFMGSSGAVWRFGVAFGGVLNGGTATLGSHVLCGVADGANSRLLVDGAVVAAGNVPAASATRIILGADGAAANYAPGGMSLAGLYAGDFTAHASYDDFMGWV